MTIEEIIGKVFNVDPEELDDSSSRSSIKGWDSMGHLNLILALEEEFQVSIAIADAIEIRSVENIKYVLRNYGVLC